MTDEQQLLTDLREQDPDAFTALFDTYADRIYRLAISMLESEVEAECVVQDAFTRLFESLDGFEGRSKLGTWLYRVAYNLSIDRLRKRRPDQPLADEADFEDESGLMPAIFADWGEAPEPVLTSNEAQAELAAAIAALPDSLRSVFILREVEELSTAEAAEVLDISEGAVKVRLHRARLELRERLSGYFSERIQE
ncbi:MAG: sigma-70 family RNA polymerase sigma factor [Anaerolineales bacterium]|nr:sigma-70 family RNA polymerase sigma factor [Anaerolineales bacterium]